MNNREIAQALMDAIQKGDFDHARTLLADDFQFSGPVPEPINADAWLGMSASMHTAFPNLDYHFKAIGSEGEIVKATSQLSGTHTGPFDLSNMDMGVIPATNNSFSAAVEKSKITVQDNKVTSWAIEPTDGAGLFAILDQLGVKTPTR